jgi:hypothetical protein
VFNRGRPQAVKLKASPPAEAVKLKASPATVMMVYFCDHHPPHFHAQ